MIPSLRTSVTGTWTGCLTQRQPSLKAEISGTTQRTLSLHLKRDRWKMQRFEQFNHLTLMWARIKKKKTHLYMVSASTSPNQTLRVGVKLYPDSSNIATSPPPFNLAQTHKYRDPCLLIQKKKCWIFQLKSYLQTFHHWDRCDWGGDRAHTLTESVFCFISANDSPRSSIVNNLLVGLFGACWSLHKESSQHRNTSSISDNYGSHDPSWRTLQWI